MQAPVPILSLYEADFHAWTVQQVKFLRSGQLSQLDIKNLAEEVESLGKQQRQELENRLGVLLGHLLKWYYQPERQSGSWFCTICHQREEIALLIKRNPSLKPYLEEAVGIGYRKGLYLFASETGRNPQTVVQACPFSLQQIFEEPIEFPEL